MQGNSTFSKEVAVGLSEKCSFGKLREASQKGDSVRMLTIPVTSNSNRLGVIRRITSGQKTMLRRPTWLNLNNYQFVEEAQCQATQSGCSIRLLENLSPVLLSPRVTNRMSKVVFGAYSSNVLLVFFLTLPSVVGNVPYNMGEVCKNLSQIVYY